MNILLINPSWPYPYGKGEHTYNRIWPPLSLANCASLLENDGHTVNILDAHALRIHASHLKKHVKGFDKIFITSSTLDKWICPNIHITPFLEAVRHIRTVNPSVFIMGYHGTSNPESILKQTKAQAILLGEPELSIRKICRDIPYDQIINIAYYQGKHFICQRSDTPLNLEELPVPAYHLLNISQYAYEVLGNRFMLFETSRGCKHNCQFCSKIMAGNTLRYKTFHQIQNELTAAIEKYHVRYGYFIDLDFLSRESLAHQICDFLIQQGYPFNWCCQTRPDTLNLELLKKMKQAGCQLIHLGIESGLQKFLDLTHKNITVQNSERAVALCKQADIITLGFYVFGFKGETELDREKTFQFAKRLNTNFISFHKVHPYTQNSEIYLQNLQNDSKIDSFIRKKLLLYYLRYSYLRNLNFCTAIKCFKLFVGRLFSL
jgi:radical SAM superfamily enzyme YgiQ (UPF0313 family)